MRARLPGECYLPVVPGPGGDEPLVTLVHKAVVRQDVLAQQHLTGQVDVVL